MNAADPEQRLKSFGWRLQGLGVLLALLLVLVAECLAYRPTDRRASACVRRIGELQKLLKEERRVRADYARLTRELTTLRRQAADLQKRIPDEPREADFLAQVSRLAGKVGLQIQDYRPGRITPQRGYSALQVDLICRGDYAGICKFLDGLSKLPRYSTVIRLQIDAHEARPNYHVEISLRVLFFTDNDRPAGEETETADE